MQWFALPTGVKKSNMWDIQIYAFLIKKSLDQPLWAFPSSKPALYGTIKFNSYNANDKKRMLVLKGANLKKLHILEWHMFKMSFDWWMFLYYTPLRLKIVFSISLVLVFFFFSLDGDWVKCLMVGQQVQRVNSDTRSTGKSLTAEQRSHGLFAVKVEHRFFKRVCSGSTYCRLLQ